MANADISRRVKVPIPPSGGTTIDQGLPQPSGHGDGDHDPRLKKIYVYADDVWSSHATTDSRIVRVQTPAFDLTGWIDFTRARQQDQFHVEIRVNLAHAANVLFSTSAFQGGVLAYMQQFTPGANYISGNFIDVVIRQIYSPDNFATQVPVAYQFIVESQ